MRLFTTSRRLAVPVCAVLTVVAPAMARIDEDHEQARQVYRTLCDRLVRVWNYRCVQLTPARPRMRFGQSAGTVYDRTELAFDAFGRSCVCISEGLDATSIAWDGHWTVVRREETKPNGTVAYSASAFPARCYDTSGYNVPWVCLGGQLALYLEEALEKEHAIGVTATEHGRCRVAIHRNDGTGTAAVLDLNRGAIPVALEYYRQGELRQRQEIKGAESERGTWFPVEVRSTIYYSADPNTGEPLPIFTTTRRFTDIRINDPEFYRHVQPALPPDTQAVDNDFGLLFKVGQTVPGLRPYVVARAGSEGK